MSIGRHGPIIAVRIVSHSCAGGCGMVTPGSNGSTDCLLCDVITAWFPKVVTLPIGQAMSFDCLLAMAGTGLCLAIRHGGGAPY